MSSSVRAGKLNVQQLITFQNVYEMGGYARAAAVLGLSVPTAWQHIRALEKAYGVRLFRKVGRQVEPTAPATRLYYAVDALLVELDSTFALVNEASAAEAPLRVVTGNRMMLEDLALPMAEFQKEYANRLVIRHGNNRRAEDLLLSDEVDIGFSLEPGPNGKSPRIHYEPAYQVDFLAVAPKKHPYFQSTAGGLRELVKYPLLVTAPGTHGREALEQSLHRENLTAEIAVETDNSGFTIACARAGMGLGILAGNPRGELCRKLAIKSLRRQLGRRRIVFMWRKRLNLTKPMLGLIEAVKKQSMGER